MLNGVYYLIIALYFHATIHIVYAYRSFIRAPSGGQGENAE